MFILAYELCTKTQQLTDEDRPKDDPASGG